MLVMRDVARKEEQEASKEEIPIRGNEYPDHTKQKTRAYQLLKADDWDVMYERELLCFNEFTKEPNKYPYSLDVYAYKFFPKIVRDFRIGVEIQREGTGGGHGSKITKPKDRNRAEEIFNQHGIIVIPFNVAHMKAASDEDILDEIYQSLGLVS